MSKDIMKNINEGDWENLVEKAKQPVAVMFYSPTCTHCQVMKPFFQEYAEDFKTKIRFFLINILDNQYITSRYGVMGIPTFKFFCQGRPVQELVGEIYPPLLKKTLEDILHDGKRCINTSTKIDYTITGYG